MGGRTITALAATALLALGCSDHDNGEKNDPATHAANGGTLAESAGGAGISQRGAVVSSGGAGTFTGGAGATSGAGGAGSGSARQSGAGAGGMSSGSSGSGTGGSQTAGTGATGMSEGSVPPPCRTTLECPAPWVCQLPDYRAPGCRGMPCAADIAVKCTSNSACAPAVCSVMNDVACSGGTYRTCHAACTDDSQCAGLACQPDGRCLPRNHCTLGTKCPIHNHCADQDRDSDAFGCVRDTCKDDVDCTDPGYCLAGHCYLQLGTCMKPSAACLAP